MPFWCRRTGGGLICVVLVGQGGETNILMELEEDRSDSGSDAEWF